MKKTTLSAITALLIATTGINASISISLDDNKTTNKDIVVSPNNTQTTKPTTPAVVVNLNRPTEQVTITQTTPKPKVEKYDDTISYAKAFKNNYLVGEEIKIKLSLKRDAYIYFWTISADGKGYLILPNDFEVISTYKKNRDYVVPNEKADYQFVSDRVGVEEVFVLATSKPISKNEITKIFKDKTSIVPTAPKEQIQSFMTKDIIVIAQKEKFEYDVESFQIGVREAPKPPVTTPIKVETSGTQVNITITK